MTALSLAILPESADDGPAIDRLTDHTFGPGRYARTAFRLREGTGHLPDVSFIARVGTFLVGSVRLSAIEIGTTPALLLGPLTVDPAFRSRGIGGALVERSLEAARAAGHRLVLLVGDAPYYGRFGFAPVPRGTVELPGPVDKNRVLIAELVAGARDGVAGRVRPAFADA